MPAADTPKRKLTWIEVAVANGGFRKAIKALSWAHSWIYVEVALGREPSVDEVAEWWFESRRTAFREQAAFRECFPMLDNPAPLYAKPYQRERVEKGVAQLATLEAALRRARRPADSEILSAGLLNP
jgi:hypothetical protein